jgi:hypothetical protein
MSNNVPPNQHSPDYANPGQRDTPNELAVIQNSADLDEENDGSTSPRKRLTRAVGKGVDNLTKSFSGSGRSTQQQRQTAVSPPPGHRRLFSLNRKGKSKDMSQTSGSPDGE